MLCMLCLQAVEELAAEQEKDRVMRMANILGFVVVRAPTVVLLGCASPAGPFSMGAPFLWVGPHSSHFLASRHAFLLPPSLPPLLPPSHRPEGPGVQGTTCLDGALKT